MPAEWRTTCFFTGCRDEAVANITLYDRRQCIRDEYACDAHINHLLSSHQPEFLLSAPRHPLEAACQFDFHSIVYYKGRDQQVIYLQESGGQRFFAVSLGYYEAFALIQSLQRVGSTRPLTYESMFKLMKTLGGQLEQVLIYDVVKDADSLYYCAFLRVIQSRRTIDFDCRPSDAFNLAALSDAPVFILEDVLKRADAFRQAS